MNSDPSVPQRVGWIKVVRGFVARRAPRFLMERHWRMMGRVRRWWHPARRRIATLADRSLNRLLPRRWLVAKETVKYEDYWRRERRSAQKRGNTVGDKVAVGKAAQLLRFSSVLDVGCGPGQSVLWFLAHGYAAHGCDIARHAVENPVPELQGKSVLSCAPASSLPFADSSFDLVFCTDVMEHIPDRAVDASIREMRRVARKYLFLTICLYPSTQRNRIEYHASVHPREWWEHRLESAGLTERRDLEATVRGSETMVVNDQRVAVEYFILEKPAVA